MGLNVKRQIAAGCAAIAIVGGIAGCSSSTAKPASAQSPGAAEVNPSGDIPDSIAYVAFTVPGKGFQVSTPESFARADVGSLIVFTDRLNSITIESGSADKPPSAASVMAGDVPKLSKSYAAFASPKLTEVSRKSGSAVMLTFTADSAPDPVTGKVIHLAVERYYFFHNAKTATLTLAGPKGADNVDPWRIVTDSLRWL